VKRSKHDRAVRGYSEYEQWKSVADFLDTNPSKVEILRWVCRIKMILSTRSTERRLKDALEVFIADRYPEIKVMEALKGDQQDGEKGI